MHGREKYNQIGAKSYGMSIGLFLYSLLKLWFLIYLYKLILYVLTFL